MQKSQVKRLHSLLTIKDSAANIPKNLEAGRRLQFFMNSLFMEMPAARPVNKMLSFRWYLLHAHVSMNLINLIALNEYCTQPLLCSPFCSVFTPYYSEIVLYSMNELLKKNEDGISILFYLQKIYPGTVIHYTNKRYIYAFCFLSL